MITQIIIAGSIGLVYLLMLGASILIEGERRDARRRAERHYLKPRPTSGGGALTRHIR